MVEQRVNEGLLCLSVVANAPSLVAGEIRIKIFVGAVA
jgi:hypothetical protein